jgi:hypothetical protein
MTGSEHPDCVGRLYEAAGALVGEGGYFDHSFLEQLKAAYDAFPAPPDWRRDLDQVREDLELLADALTTEGT